MTMNAIMKYDEMQSIGRAMAKSGYFQDARDEAQAIVKILAGSEIGIGPFAAMTGIHIIKGKPVLGANLVATLIKNEQRYDYRIVKLDDDGCEIDFFENGAKVGSTTFTKDDAKAAQLAGDNWKKFPRNMYFARAISNGAKWYTPGVFGGAPVYTPDEFGTTVDADGDVVILEAEPTRAETLIGEITGDGPKPNGSGAPDENPFRWLIDDGLVNHAKHATNLATLLDLADLDEGEQRDRVSLYRAWKDYGLDTDPAAEFAKAGKLPDEAPESVDEETA
jgi:hypothetical protein